MVLSSTGAVLPALSAGASSAELGPASELVPDGPELVPEADAEEVQSPGPTLAGAQRFSPTPLLHDTGGNGILDFLGLSGSEKARVFAVLSKWLILENWGMYSTSLRDGPDSERPTNWDFLVVGPALLEHGDRNLLDAVAVCSASPVRALASHDHVSDH
jgi:hypothetical protein